MTNMESDLVVAAARALLDLSPSSRQVQQAKPLPFPNASPSSSCMVFRSLAPDARCSNTSALVLAPASPAAVSYSSSASSADDCTASLDGYASETTMTTTQGVTTGFVEYRQQHHHHDYKGEFDAIQCADFAGTTVSLALPQDSESLSPLHCFMRRYCVEAFAATEQDLAVPRYGKSHSGRVSVGQVGIRCIHCKHRPPRQRQERAVCFPSSLKNIYHSIETWQRRHSLVCQDLPLWIKASMTELMEKSRAGAGGRRQYWEESARRLGMETTSAGVRFVRVPVDRGTGNGMETTCSSSQIKVALSATEALDKSPSIPIVHEQDKPLVTEYLYMLLEQMESCRFTEQDRSGGRSKVKDCPVGMAGMQCKHCRGKAGFGRYFPTSVQALASANSDRNIFNHITKCRKCPESTRENLKRLQDEQASLKNRRGQRKQFFECVWMRLHGGEQRQQAS